MRALRVVLAVLGGVLALVVLVAVILVKRFDPNDYKQEITAFVQERTGRTLTIERNIELSLFPWFAIETGGARLSDDPAYGDRSFVEIEELSARVRVWPLLKRRLEVGRVVLDGVVLNLGADAEGRGNWAGLLDTGDAAAAGTEPDAEAADEPRRPFVEALAVEGIEIRNARIEWHGPDGAVRYSIRDLDLISGPIRNTEPVELELEFSALDVASQAAVAIELATEAEIDARRLGDIEATLRMFDADGAERARLTLALDSLALVEQSIRSAAAEAQISLHSPPIGPESLTLDIALAALDFDLMTEALQVDGLTVQTAGTETRWQLGGERMLSAPALAGSVDLETDSIARSMDQLGLEAPAGVDPGTLGALLGRAEFAVSAAPPAVAVERYAISALGVAASGSASLGADGALAARIDIPRFVPSRELRGLLAAFLPADTGLDAVTAASARAQLAVSPDRSRIDVTELNLTLNAAQLSGTVTVLDPEGGPTYRGAVTASGIDETLLGALAGSALPSELLAADIGEFRLTTDFEYAAPAQLAVFESLALSAYGLSGDGRLRLDASGRAIALSGEARLAEFSPRALLGRFDLPVPQSSDPGVLSSARLAAAFETTGENGYFRDIRLSLDDSTITGDFSVENFADPSYRFALNADRIDVDRYLPPRAEAAAGGAAEGGTDPASVTAGEAERKLGDIRLDNEALTATVLRGSVAVDALRIGGLDFERLRTEIAVGGGRGSLDSLRTDLYGGSVAGSFAVDATAETSGIHLTGRASNLALRPLLDALIGDSNLSGSGDFELDLRGRGDTIGEAMQSAAGTMSVSFRDGAIAGFNIGRELCAVVNRARGQPAPAAAPDATGFATIRASTTVQDGIATTTELYGSTGFLELTGQGSVRLVDQWLDTSFRAQMTGPIPLGGCEQLNSRLDNPVPINFTLKGQLPEVDVGVDISQLLEDWARRELRQRAEESVRDRILRELLN